MSSTSSSIFHDPSKTFRLIVKKSSVRQVSRFSGPLGEEKQQRSSKTLFGVTCTLLKPKTNEHVQLRVTFKR